MEFKIDNVELRGNIDLSDEIFIKSLHKNYNVYFNNKTLNDIIKEIYDNNDFIFIDKNVYNLDASAFDNKNILVFDAIEDNKNIEKVLELTDKLYSINFTKKNKLIVIGGGITQDVGGFTAAIYKRGINWVLVPTTVLSMTDSCIGSKVSINKISKNILGMFISPDNIYISDYFLNSLSHRDIISGIGEALKLSLIGGETTYSLFLQKYKENDYIAIIKIALSVKKLIIEYDEFENNIRKVLNYGHTIGHAIESTTNYFIPHGTAVLIGMYIKNKLFYGDKYEDINNLILNMVNKELFDISFNYTYFIQHILSDKKNRGNDVCFILLDEIGITKIIYKNVDDFYIPLQKIIADLFTSLLKD